MAGTGGARKVRHRGRGKGRAAATGPFTTSAEATVPVFLLAIFGKGDTDNLSKAERNAAAIILLRIAEEYRKGKRK